MNMCFEDASPELGPSFDRASVISFGVRDDDRGSGASEATALRAVDFCLRLYD